MRMTTILVLFTKKSNPQVSIYYLHIPLFENTENDFSCKVDDLHSADDGEASEESHSASNCRQHVNKFCSSVLGDSVKFWSVQENPHISEPISPFII